MSFEGDAPLKHDLTDPSVSPDQILRDEQQRQTMAAFESMCEQLQRTTESFDGEQAEQRIRNLFLDIDSLRTLESHETVTNFMRFFRYSFTGDPYAESIPKNQWHEQYRVLEDRADKFSRSPRSHRSAPIWSSEAEFLNLVRTTHVVRMYGEDEDGLTVPSAVPVWIIGRDDVDSETTEYLAITFNDALPKYAATDYDDLYDHHNLESELSNDDALMRASQVVYGLRHTDEYDDQQLFSGLQTGFGVVTFLGPSELPELAKQFSTEDLHAISRTIGKKRPRLEYDLRPRALAERIDDENLPIALGLGKAELTAATTLRMNVAKHLASLAGNRNLISRLNDIEEKCKQKYIGRVQIYQRRAYPEVDISTIPEDFEIPPEWTAQVLTAEQSESATQNGLRGRAAMIARKLVGAAAS